MERFKRLKQSKLLKFSSLNAINVFIKIGAGVISAKLLALFVGPIGIAFIGNFRNFMNSLETMVGLGFQNGIVKYVAEHKEEPKKLAKVISTLLISLLVTCFCVSLLLFIFANTLNRYIFGIANDFVYLFYTLPVLLPFYLAAIYITSIINGFGKSKEVLYINIIGNVLALVITTVLVTNYQIKGALLALIVSPALLFAVTLFYLNQIFKIKTVIHFKLFEFEIVKVLSQYFLMALVSGVLGPIVALAIRNHLIEISGLTHGGYWEAMQRISFYYFMFISVLVSVYYYPQLIEAKNNKETNAVFWDYYKKVIPVFVGCMIVFFQLKYYLITFLYSAKFIPVGELFIWQIIGDVFKSISLILGMQFFAKKITKAFIITELISLAVSYFFSVYFIDNYGYTGVAMAHTCTYILYVLVLSIYFRKILFFSKSRIN
ncbi:O-antigen translocase [Flavobacterium sp.]|uniref:O-antigen translocase n=1 Tax=Flavobacterium sp. TaxID=239 RepID=UPI003D14C10C